MAYVIAEPCDHKDKACAGVCPSESIKEGSVEVDGVVYTQMFIDGETCIECGLCANECPMEAIFMADDLPAKWSKYQAINAEFYRSGTPA